LVLLSLCWMCHGETVVGRSVLEEVPELLFILSTVQYGQSVRSEQCDTVWVLSAWLGRFPIARYEF
jgi:hypothetical protein